MSGRRAAEAVQDFLDTTQQIVSCITDSVVSIHGGYHVSVEPHNLTLGPVEPVRLVGNSRLSFSIIVHYRIVEDAFQGNIWRVMYTSYFYTLSDHNGREVLAYHWHPNQRSFIHSPHMHLEAGAMVGRTDVANAHLPTGWVSLTDVVQLAITDLNVAPRRDDWQDVLEQARSHERLLHPL